MLKLRGYKETVGRCYRGSDCAAAEWSEWSEHDARFGNYCSCIAIPCATLAALVRPRDFNNNPVFPNFVTGVYNAPTCPSSRTFSCSAMVPPLYNICFPDIFGQIAGYLSAKDIAGIALLNSRFSKFVRDTGLLYGNVDIAFKHTKSRRKATSDETIRKFLPSLQEAPQNAALLNSLTIRHRFSGYLPSEEMTYVERIAKIAALSPNLSHLSLHLSNFATSYYITGPNNEYMKIPEGATRAFFCQAFCDGEIQADTPRIIDLLLASLGNLRSLNWCVECRPSGLLSEDWKASRLREELEMIDRACPKLESLGLLNFYDSRVSDAIIQEVAADGTENFIVDGDNAVSGILPNLRELIFHIGGERDQEKILSAAVLGIALGTWRRISSRLVPWCQEKPNQKLIIEDIRHVMKIQELVHKQMNISMEEFLEIWGQYLHADVTFEITVYDQTWYNLDLLNLLSSHANSVNIALKADDLSLDRLHSLAIPQQTESLSIDTNCIPLSAIGKLTSHLKLRTLKVNYTYTRHQETDEKVMMVLIRDRPSQEFTQEWASEPIMSFNMAIWGDMVACDYGENLFEAVVGRAIGRTTWESRKNLESITRTLFEKSGTLTKVEVVASYPLYREELASPRLFKL